MDDEILVSGYCRAQDQSRMVTLEKIDGRGEADCAWPDCPYSHQCKLAERFREETEV